MRVVKRRVTRGGWGQPPSRTTLALQDDPESQCARPAAWMASTRLPAALAMDGIAAYGQRSISPITMSRDPTTAGTSAIRHPRHSSEVTDRLENELDRARARHGIADPSPTR
jgi:hypothetical protein